MSFRPVRKLTIKRTLSTGDLVNVGVLAQSKQGVFFQYDESYTPHFGNLSPFMLEPTSALQPAAAGPHNGLHGVFADSLPDGWGMLLQDRVFRQHGIHSSLVTLMDRLAFVGSRGSGALSYAPESDFVPSDTGELDTATLGMEAQAVFDGQPGDILDGLIAASGSGGARPKAQVYFAPEETRRCRTIAQAGDEAWIVKFTSRNLPLGHAEGLCEATYLQLAEAAALQPPEWRLIEAAHSNVL